MSGYDTLAARLTIPLDASQLWHHRPACTELVRRAHRAGLLGASVFQGVTALARLTG
jgi:PII-like signaling protein